MMAGLFDRQRRYSAAQNARTPWLFLMPALIVIAGVIIYPFFYQLYMSFFKLNMFTIYDWLNNGPVEFVGLSNYIHVLTSSPLQTVSFTHLFIRTLAWTFINIFFHVMLGLALALLLKNKIAGRRIYQTLLIIPWAMPQVVAILAWRGEFHPKFGFINQLLTTLGYSGVNWWSDPWPVFLSCILVNIWLGTPFMMVVFLGGLQAIPQSLYEAAALDGARLWQRFTSITWPLLKGVVLPSVILGTIWTFNNINVIYLMTGQDGGNEYADILVSALFKSAFTYSRYGYAAAFSMISFLMLGILIMAWVMLNRSWTKQSV